MKKSFQPLEAASRGRHLVFQGLEKKSASNVQVRLSAR